MTLTNANCSAKFSIEHKRIFVEDHRDQYNLPAAYNRTRRGIKKAWAALEAGWSDNIGFHEAVNVLSDSGLGMRCYCMMD